MKFNGLLFFLIISAGLCEQTKPGFTDTELIGGELGKAGTLITSNGSGDGVSGTSGESQIQDQDTQEPTVLSGRDGMGSILDKAKDNPAIQQVMDLGWDTAVEFYIENGVYRMPTGLVSDLAEAGVIVDFDRSSSEIQAEIDEKQRVIQEKLEEEERRKKEEEERRKEAEEQEKDEDSEESAQEEKENQKEDETKERKEEESDQEKSENEDSGKNDNSGKEKETEEQPGDNSIQDTKPDGEDESKPSEPANPGNLSQLLNQPEATQTVPENPLVANSIGSNQGSQLYQVIGGQMVPVEDPRKLPKNKQFAPDSNGIWWPQYVQARENPIPGAQVALPNSIANNTVPANAIAQRGSSPFPKPNMSTKPVSVEETLVNW